MQTPSLKTSVKIVKLAETPSYLGNISYKISHLKQCRLLVPLVLLQKALDDIFFVRTFRDLYLI